jgi:hypothetical protein
MKISYRTLTLQAVIIVMKEAARHAMQEIQAQRFSF